MKERKLTTKQKFFIAEYQKDWNATSAAVKAGYSPNRPDRAGEIGYQLLQKTPIKEALERATAERLRKIGLRNERVLTEVVRVGLSDLRKLYNENGTLKLPHEWSDEAAAAVAGVEVLEEFSGKGKDRILSGHTKKIRVFDKVRALELLLKQLGIIGNGRRHDEDDEEEVERVLTTLELSAKIVYILKVAAEREANKEAQKALGGKSLDEKPKELLK